MDEPMVSVTNNQMNNSTDTNAVFFVQANFPMQIGNYWDYNFKSISAVYNDYGYTDSTGYMPPLLIDSFQNELRREITKDSLVNNNTYFVLENSIGSQTELLRIENGAYYLLK